MDFACQGKLSTKLGMQISHTVVITQTFLCGICVHRKKLAGPDMTINTYKVEPFSGPMYSKNFRNLGPSEYGCAICGKPVSEPYANPVSIVLGGTWALTQEEADDLTDPGHMGVWGIGPDCHKKYLVRRKAAG